MTDVLDESRKFWDAHAERDPLWAALSDAGKEERRWDLRRFFQTGVNEVALVLYQLQSLGIEVSHRSALDFGCGVGRLTQALASRFERVVGVDISPKMIEAASALNAFPTRASYIWNAEPHLRRFNNDTFDFIYTNLVLQHIVPEVTLAYLREFLRILSPAGLLVFQLPSRERGHNDVLPESIARAMPDDAYQAAIGIAGVPMEPVGPGAELTLDVDVSNASQLSWSQEEFGMIRVGNHWLDGPGQRMLQRDDGRTALPETLPPGGTCRVSLTITTPAEDGDYQCEVDLAHEGVRWFCDRDSAVVRFSVAVRRGGLQHLSMSPTVRVIAPARQTEGADASRLQSSSAAPGDAGVADPGDFPMYGVHADVVAQLIAANGGELLQRLADGSCGRNWISYRYFVRKAAVP
jgi:SAM-dependent methyltransferase